MYGAIAHFQLKPGMVREILARGPHCAAGLPVVGLSGEYYYRMDGDAQDYVWIVLFESKESYLAHVNSPTYTAHYRRVRALIEGEIEWHHGEIVFAYVSPEQMESGL